MAVNHFIDRSVAVTLAALHTATGDVRGRLQHNGDRHGRHPYHTRAELLGVLQLEMREVETVVHKRRPNEELVHELVDLAAGALWEVASIRQHDNDTPGDFEIMHYQAVSAQLAKLAHQHGVDANHIGRILGTEEPGLRRRAAESYGEVLLRVQQAERDSIKHAANALALRAKLTSMGLDPKQIDEAVPYPEAIRSVVR